ncbi:NTP pyrophosphohydrolase [Pilimelia terevasa]|uniref:NTP pyrophosphohydrolase n=1 Tax=Pilimelia terevasa TaxID=53372 RepID=UPI00166A8D45|nr:NTP pyrophosphohydrolase [Pilimelia terevasa]
MQETLVVDAANTIGSVPDGWWRDRAGAVTRLRDALAALADEYAAIVLVVEGAARDVPGTPAVRVVSAPASGDDAVVAAVAAAGPPCTVVTSDRELRARVTALGAAVRGPRTLPRW